MPLTEAQRAAIRADAIASGEVPEHLRADAIRLLSAPASSSSAGASAVHPAGGGLGRAGRATGPFSPTVVERFWSRVDRTGGPDACWPWTAARTAKGYGKFKGAGTFFMAHRYAYELENGPIADGHHVDHRCGTEPCCNPLHLEAVTPRVNNLRSARHDRPSENQCPRGHELTDDNLYVHPGSGKRECWACVAIRSANRGDRSAEYQRAAARRRELQQAGSTAPARGRAPRRTSDGKAVAPVPNRSTTRKKPPAGVGAPMAEGFSN